MSDDIYQVIENSAKATRPRMSAEAGVFTGQAERQPFDKEKWAAQKKAEREQAYAMLDKATERVADEPQGF